MPGEAVTRAGTAIANTIHGGEFADVLSGLGGNDTLYGHGGNDTMNGGGGNDVLVAVGGGDTLLGGAGKDSLEAGNGDDFLAGGGSKDILDGGAGTDRFIYAGISDSTSTAADTLRNADFGADLFDLTVAVAAIDVAITTGLLRKSAFDADLATAVDAAHLGAGNAVLFTPDDGRLAGKTFLVVDANATAGYQAGEDYVIQLANAVNLANLGIEDFI
jgi:Ca2+-binding RTX toxin-like protein